MIKQRKRMAEQPKPKYTFSYYFYNNLTYAGVVLSGMVFIAECILFGIEFYSGYSNLYLGLFTYVALPPFLILGLLLIPLGAVRKRSRVKKGLADIKPRSFMVDPSRPTHRNAIMVFIIGTVALFVMTAVGSYKAFHYTESVHFCGETCHEVMKPEFVTYTHSPHARVKCVECHIGAGADWYVRAKISGIRQVFRTIDRKYPRPIPTPVHNLRPAKETCEQCHWPGKSFNSIEMKRTYYSTDKDVTTPWRTRLLLRVGGKENQDSGVHSHMYEDSEIYYAADDEKRQQISWVKSVSKAGGEHIYTTENSPYKDKLPEPDKIRKMDCMDCHTRAAHRFKAPTLLLDTAMNRGQIDPSIPQIKAQAMKAMSKTYVTTKEAAEKIKASLLEYYQKTQAEYYAGHAEGVNAAIDMVVKIFEENLFPEMKARWDEYPDNIGHLMSPGCFRCHDGQHRSNEGKTVSRDCLICHTIIEQGPLDALQKNSDGLEFQHPFADDGSWKEMNCSDCHTGN